MEEAKRIKFLDTLYRYEHLMYSYRESLIIEKALWKPTDKIKDIATNVGVDISKSKFRLFELGLFTLNSCMQKEKYILDKKDLILNNDLVGNYVKTLANEKYEDGSFLICEKKFQDSTEFLNTIRNKFAHGEYKYDLATDEILMVVEGKDFYFPYKWLKFYNYIFLYNIHKLLTDGYYHEIITKIDTHSWQKITNFNDYRRALKGMKYLDFEIKPKKDKEYNDLEIFKLSMYMDEILKKIKSGNNYFDELNQMKKFCEEKDLIFKFEIKNVIGNDTPEEIKEKLYGSFYSNQFIIDFDADYQSYYVSQIVVDCIYEYDSRDYLRLGLCYLDEFINRINFTEGECTFADYLNTRDMPALQYDKIRSILVLNKFNLLFNYNLEEVYNNYFNYAVLDLSKIKEKYNFFEDLTLTKIENMQSDIIRQLRKLYLENNQTSENITELTTIKIKYNKGAKLDDAISINEQKFNEQLKKINELEQKLLEIEQERKKYEEYLCTNPIDSQNKNIINHIRNSIQHGTFTIERELKNSNMTDFIITFKDIYKGKVTYEGRVSLQELYEISQAAFKQIKTMFNIYFDDNKELCKKYML